jgi:DNA-binding NarL/FixJ family response regulator
MNTSEVRSTPLRVLLADDHQTVRQGLKLLIDSQPDMTVVAEADGGRVALERAQGTQPDVVVLDVSMPEMNGLVAARELKRLHPNVAIVTLTRHSDDAYLHELLRAGVAAYVLKQSAATELLHAIRAAAAGHQYLDAAITQRVTSTFIARERKGDRPHATISLSDRESSVLRMLALGYSNKEIAADLDISVKTVEAHKANAVRKLGLNGRVDVVRYAMLQGWLQDE